MMTGDIVGFCGNHTRPSRTSTLVGAIVNDLARGFNCNSQTFDLKTLGSAFGNTLSKDNASPAHKEAWQAVEQSRILVVGTPVYKGTYTGLFKHFFDLFDPAALRAKPVILTANARSPGHALMIEHQLTPLFQFFGALICPATLFALDEAFIKADSGGYHISDALQARINETVGTTKKLLHAV